MRLIRQSRSIFEYGLFFAALLPTLLVLFAAVICLADTQGVAGLTMPALPIYRAS